MTKTSTHDITVVGAGVLGLAIAMQLARAGLRVDLWDDPEAGESASSVAAGMLAPLSEAIYDPIAASHRAFLDDAMSRWTGFQQLVPGLELGRSGTILLDGPDPPNLEGFDRAPARTWARFGPAALFAPYEECVADVGLALKAIRATFSEAGGVITARRFVPGDRKTGRAVIFAAGSGCSTLSILAPELSRLKPVKGQIAILKGGPAEGPTVRWPGGYMVPHPNGALVGATMEAGVSDTTVQMQSILALRDEAAAYLPELAGLEVSGRAGVRMQTPDGLPLVGPSRTPGVLVAAGARRNGWLLAPLVSEMIAAYVTGAEPGRWARSLHPGRFEV